MRLSVGMLSVAASMALLLGGCGGGGGSDTSGGESGGVDTQKPHISLLGDKTLLLNIGQPFQDPGATAIDDVDGDISSKITKEPSTIDTQKPGEYEIIYSVSDRAGNVDTAKRKVIVVEVVQNPQMRKNSGVVINEVLATNSHTVLDPDFKQFADFIELYNNSASEVDIGGFFLSDDPDQPNKWQIPDGTTIPAKGYLMLWADKENQGLHTNFSLDGDGETLTLYDAGGAKVDQILFKKQKRDISVTRLGEQNYYMEPSPNSPNSAATNVLLKSKKPVFEQESGFYNGAQKITLSSPNGAKIYYTLDGSIPTKSSSLYTQPISISKTTVIRARALEDGKFLSSMVNHTYLIDENVHLPVVSVAIDAPYLYDEKFGIYVIGTDENGNPHPDDHIHPNFEQPWMRPAGIEYIKDGKSIFSENVGIKLHGNFSRRYANKSFAVYAKDTFGTKSIDYPLFEQKPYIKKVRSFILRNSGNDWKDTMIRDGFMHTLVKDNMDIDYAAYQPAVVFLNGEYRGILNIREKENENYLRDNHNVDPKNVDLLENLLESSEDVMAGDTAAYKELLDYLQTHSLSVEANYDHVASLVDTEEFMNYMITEIYVGNTDWLGKNVRYWRERKEGAKWRWLLQDLDFGFGLMNESHVGNNTLELATKDSIKTLVLRSLLANAGFKNRFISHFTSHLNTTFTPDRVRTMIEAFKDRIKDEMPRDISRWKNQGRRINSYEDWQNSVDFMIDFGQQREAIVRDQLKTKFNLGAEALLSLAVPENGTLYVDGIKLESAYSGRYFTGTKVTLKAVPKEGYRFVAWSDGDPNQTKEVAVQNNTSVSALFEKAVMPKIVIDEINYKSAKEHDSDDWIEIYNNDTQAIDLSGWTLRDDSAINEGYTIPSGTVLAPGSYFVFCQNLEKFSTFYTIKNVQGDLPFGLGKKEDEISLYNAQGALVDRVHYDSSWPDAKGNGKTLALVDPNSDNAQSSNWIAAEGYGTPGERNQ